ncbi:glycosyltransferase [Leptolyngbya ohadii]|uniref:glycosyltransferase n=1 Tax=Leptolyngbya ohadii TaxID=1962290 RepID=UPI000B59A2A4|nr:glycosyltransferase [Leptolyngbya ohadii]
MKIAIITSGFLPVVDGVTVTVWHRLQKLSRDGHQVLVLCPDYQPIASVYPQWQQYVGEILPGVRVVPLQSEPFLDLQFERNVSGKAFPELMRHLAAFQPEIIHVDEPDRLHLSMQKVVGVAYAKQHSIPCIGFFHTNLIEYIEDYLSLPKPIIAILQQIARCIVRGIYNSYDATLVGSNDARQKLTRMGIKKIIQGDFLGIDLSQYRPELKHDRFFAEKYRLPSVDSKTKLTFLGRLTPDKGWKFTLKAFETIGHRCPQPCGIAANSPVDLSSIAVLIAGDGSMEAEICDRLKAILPEVHLLGRIPPEDVPALLLNSDLHITASQKETKGLTVLEAGAAGIPVLAPRAGGVVDSIYPAQNGELFEPDNINDFLRKLRFLLEHSQIRQQMGESGRSLVAQHSWDRAIDRLVEVWEEQINLKR